jgi:DNA-binding CsgD family transcriptional regulator
MLKVQVTSQIEIDLDEVLKSVAQLESDDLEQVVNQFLALQARRRASSLSPSETDLLQQINQGLPPSLRARYEELNAKLHEETMTPAEHEELLQLSDQIEQSDAERLRRLIALAQLRQISVDTLMDQLGIRRPPAHA